MPGRPGILLSPASPDVPFLKKGRETDDDAFSQNEMGFPPGSANASAPLSTYRNSHHMMTRASNKMCNNDVSLKTLTQNKNKMKVLPNTMAKSNDILIHIDV
jgi:hypothetical protein